jgi:type I restriction enzyme, S subunit
MLPNEWKVAPLSQLAAVQTGLAKNAQKAPIDPVELPYLRVANVQDGFLDLSEIKTVRIERSLAPRYLLQQGDVLFTEGGDNDKLGRGTIWQSEIPHCLHQNHIFVVRTNQTKLHPQFLSILAASRYGKAYFLKCAKQSTNLASINSTQLNEFPVLLPPIGEQQAIVDVLASWDRAIDLTTQLIAAKQQRKRGLMQELLTRKRRFAEFEGEEWQEVRLGEIFSERYESGYTHLPLLSVTSKGGIVARDTLERRDTSAADKSKYLRICKGDLGYNTMRMWQGVSSVSELEGIVSPAYTICVPSSGIDVYFMAYLFKFRPMVFTFWRYSQGLVDDTLSLKFDTFSKIRVQIPRLTEQRRIAAVLQACDREIALLEQKRDLLRQQKQGLMQQLLTGRVRVNVDPVVV